MADFADVNGKKWTILVDGPLVDKLHQELKLDITTEDGTGLIRCCQTGAMIVRACYILCEDQVKAEQVTPADFGKRMASGTVIEEAEKAIREAVLFFTRPKRRQTFTAVLEAQDKVTEATMQGLRERVEDPTTQAKIVDAAKAKMLDVVDNIVQRLGPSPRSAKDSPDTWAVVPKESPSEP